MATDNWNIPDNDAAEQEEPIDAEEEAAPPPGTTVEADEADALEQAQDLPDDDDYREE